MASVVLGLGTALATSRRDFSSRGRAGELAESSTVDNAIDEHLVDEIGALFDQASGEFFRDGVSSTFSRRLSRLLRKHGREAFRAIAHYLSSRQASPDVVSEALRWLADFSDPSVLSQQWFILEQGLKDRSPRVRDGAILGFATLDHPGAKPILLNARDVEQIGELRVLIEQVIVQLERRR